MAKSCIRLKADENQIKRCRNIIEEKSSKLDKMANFNNLLGNKIRLSIVYLLNEEKELCVCDLSDILQMTIPAVSQHLKKLKVNSIVKIRKDGPTYYYSLNKDVLVVLTNFFNQIKFELVL